MVFWYLKKSTPPSVDAMLLVNDFELMPKESFDYKLGSLVIAGAWPWPFLNYMNKGDTL